MDASEPVTIYTTTNPAEAEVIRVALQAEGIESQATGTNQGGLIGTLDEITVVVHAADAVRARRVIDAARQGPKGPPA